MWIGDKFLNGAATIETLLSPEDLLAFLHRIEEKADRKREIHWGPRTLDLDILLYDDVCIHTKDRSCRILICATACLS